MTRRLADPPDDSLVGSRLSATKVQEQPPGFNDQSRIFRSLAHGRRQDLFIVVKISHTPIDEREGKKGERSFQIPSAGERARRC